MCTEFMDGTAVDETAMDRESMQVSAMNGVFMDGTSMGGTAINGTAMKGVSLAADGTTLSWSIVNSSRPTLSALANDGRVKLVEIEVEPVRSAQVVQVAYRYADGPLKLVPALPDAAVPSGPSRCFRAVVPGDPQGRGLWLQPQLQSSPMPLPCASSYLGQFSACLSSSIIGVTKAGLRIDWQVVEGRFEGPVLHGKPLAGFTDRMCIRPDGVALINVVGGLLTDAGTALEVAYQGVVDLGSDGYQRASRNDFDPLLALVVTPRFNTNDPKLQWLNRIQCLGVGQVNTSISQIMLQIYAILPVPIAGSTAQISPVLPAC
jgi:hypothetical protein